MGHGLTVKQRRFVREYVRTGNGTAAALVAYETTDARTAHAIATENLHKPAVHEAVVELLDENGLSNERLAEIHAHYLALYRSDDPAEKALGLKALDMAYRLKGAYRTLDATAEEFANAVISAYACRKAALAPARAPVIEAPKGHGGSVQ